MKQRWFDTILGMGCWVLGSGFLAMGLDWSIGAQVGLYLMGVPIVAGLFKKEQ